MASTLEIVQGEVDTLEVAVKDADGIAVDLTGAALTLHVKRSINDTTALITKIIGTGITITDALAGLAEIAFAVIDTSGLLPGTYLYDLKYAASGNTVIKYAIPPSAFIITKPVTT